MRKRYTLLVVPALLALGMVLPAAGAPSGSGAASAQAQLLELEQTWLQATEHRDLAALDRILSDDYTDINYRGVVRHKADALRTSNVSSGRSAQTLSEEEVRLYGDTAVVTGRGTLAAGNNVYHWRFTDVFRKSGGGWQAVSSQETAESAG